MAVATKVGALAKELPDILGENNKNVTDLQTGVKTGRRSKSLQTGYKSTLLKGIDQLLSANSFTRNNRTIKSSATQLETSGKTLTGGASQLSANSGTLTSGASSFQQQRYTDKWCGMCLHPVHSSL